MNINKVVDIPRSEVGNQAHKGSPLAALGRGGELQRERLGFECFLECGGNEMK